MAKLDGGLDDDGVDARLAVGVIDDAGVIGEATAGQQERRRRTERIGQQPVGQLLHPHRNTLQDALLLPRKRRASSAGLRWVGDIDAAALGPFKK